MKKYKNCIVLICLCVCSIVILGSCQGKSDNAAKIMRNYVIENGFINDTDLFGEPVYTYGAAINDEVVIGCAAPKKGNSIWFYFMKGNDSNVAKSFLKYKNGIFLYESYTTRSSDILTSGEIIPQKCSSSTVQIDNHYCNPDYSSSRDSLEKYDKGICELLIMSIDEYAKKAGISITDFGFPNCEY